MSDNNKGSPDLSTQMGESPQDVRRTSGDGKVPWFRIGDLGYIEDPPEFRFISRRK